MPVAALAPETHNSTTATHSLGQEYTALFNGERAVFRFVRVVDQAVADGDCVLPASATSWDVTSDFSGGSAITTEACVGVAVGAISQNRYGFVMIRGRHDAVNCVSTVGIGDHLMPPSVTDGRAEEATAAGDPPSTAEWKIGLGKFGVALSAASSNACAALVNCM